MLFEVIKFIIYSFLIVIISKKILVVALRNLAETLNLKPKTVGNIAGISTSVPELLTITTSSIRGLAGASIYNILSSNIINLIQYFATILINKNTHKLKNNAIKTDIILVIITIIIPIIFLRANVELNINIVPLFVLFYTLFRVLNNSSHKVYLDIEDDNNEVKEKQQKIEIRSTIKYIIILLVTGVLLYIVGELLGNTLENLCNIFSVPQFVVGILLGFITSIPELMTFFESQQHHNKLENEMKGVVEATNNLLTSNIMNLFVIQTIGILITNF